MNTRLDSVEINDILRLSHTGNEKITDIKIYSKYIKRILDILLSLIGLIVLIPIFLMIGIIIKLESRGPIFFVHKRIGKNGKKIGIYKFRTMLPNAEEPGPLPKASKLAKPPWEGVWPVGGENMKVMFI